MLALNIILTIILRQFLILPFIRYYRTMGLTQPTLNLGDLISVLPLLFFSKKISIHLDNLKTILLYLLILLAK